MANNEETLRHAPFTCFNVNCYATFKTERGLRQHLWRNAPCSEFMSESRPLAASIDIVHESTWCRRLGYGVQSLRLNPFMSADIPSYDPYEVFDYSAHFDADDGIDERVVELSKNNSTVVGKDDVAISCPVFHAMMERIQANERHALMVLCHDVEHRNIVNLLKLLEDAQCPDYMLQKILQWAYNAKLDGFDFNPKATSRKANILWMYNALEHSHRTLPKVLQVNLEDHNKPQDIICFDFVPALLSLLQDDSLMVMENLVINKDFPVSMFIPTDGKLGEANSGSRYRELYQQLAQGKDQLLVPIIMYLDGTVIDSKGHIDICPVSFTTSLFTEKARRDVKTWRLLGYVPDLNRGRSGAMNSFANANSEEKGRTTRNFHKVMDVMTAGLVKVQAGFDNRLKQVPLKLGDRWFVVELVCPLLFVINDGKQGDQLCCRVNGHHSSILRHHRSCDCLYEDLDNADVQCQFLSTDTINHVSRYGSQEELRQLSIYKCDNSFNRIQMGQNPHGIFMCAVVDVMHTIQHGIIMYVLDCFKKSLNAQSLAKLDRMAHIFDKTCCQSIRSSFPRTDFSRGITNLTMVECSEQSGALFLISSFIMQLEGWEFLDDHFPQLCAVLGTMESLLCFEAWLDQHTFWEIGDPDGEAADAEAAIGSLMNLITTFLPRHAGNGWKLSKFHEMKHIIRFVDAFGAPRGYNASRPEEHHKAHAKRPGRRAQKNVDTIDQQCGRRIADAFVINSIHAMFQEQPPGLKEILAPDDDEDPPTREEGSGTSYFIRSFVDPANESRLCRDVTFDTQTRGLIKLEDNLALFILQSYSNSDLDENGEGRIRCCTEYHKYSTKTDEKMVSIRCHPNYRGKGYSWYDWALIRFEDDDGNEKEYPSRVVSCLPRHETNTFDLIIQCCGEPTGRESFLFTEWTFRKEFYVVSSEAIVSLCFVLGTHDLDSNSVLIVTDKLKWASMFYESAMVDYTNRIT
jgi:hypothetical protein